MPLSAGWGSLGPARPVSSSTAGSRWRYADPDTDAPVSRGTVGEIMVRPRVPFGFIAGYHGLPEATVAAWRSSRSAPATSR